MWCACVCVRVCVVLFSWLSSPGVCVCVWCACVWCACVCVRVCVVLLVG